MKVLRFILAATMCLTMAVPAAKAQSSLVSAATSLLTQANGNNAGAALLSLYTNYKAAGRLDLTNASNIQNILVIANNIKGLKEQKNTTNFLSGLISGSKNLVNTGNATGALSALGNLSTLDLSSLGKQAAASATTNAASGLLSKLGGKSGQASASAATDSNANQAGSILTGLFNNVLGK